MPTAPPRELELATDDGGVRITEADLPLTDAELARFRLTREQFNQLFAIGMELMHGKTVSDRVRPCADQTLDGQWEVRLVHYSAFTDPLMSGRRPKGSRAKN